MAKRSTEPKTTTQLLAEYSAASNDQPFPETHAAARLQKSRAWMQWRRMSGGGPRFQRTTTGKILYRKADVEAFLAGQLTAYENTSQYPNAA